MRPQLIAHRVNTIKKLEQTPLHLGVEIDLRSQGSGIILHHEPFCNGDSFEQWLDFYQHKTLILNVKEEGLEKTVINMLSDRNINDYFFLDVSFPFLVWLSDEGINNLAVRFSEYESLETVLNMTGRAEYVWVDCFNIRPLTRPVYDKLKKACFKICIVSPELQKHDISEIETYAGFLLEQEMDIDAICTKRPELWEAALLEK